MVYDFTRKNNVIVPAFSLDNPDTEIIDDAFSIVENFNGYSLKIHIANVAKYLLDNNISLEQTRSELPKTNRLNSLEFPKGFEKYNWGECNLKKPTVKRHLQYDDLPEKPSYYMDNNYEIIDNCVELTECEYVKKEVITLEIPLIDIKEELKIFRIYAEKIKIYNNLEYSQRVSDDFLELMPDVCNDNHDIVLYCMHNYNKICSECMTLLNHELFVNGNKIYYEKGLRSARFTSPLQRNFDLWNQFNLLEEIEKKPEKMLILKGGRMS